MAKKTKAATDSESETKKDEATQDVNVESPKVSAPKKRGRGRPKGSVKKVIVKKTGKRGRPKGSKNRPKDLLATSKRPRGRPPGSGKKQSAAGGPDLRRIVTQIVREEVHAALLEAFKAL